MRTQENGGEPGEKAGGGGGGAQLGKMAVIGWSTRN